jgi:hypothetical protein
MDEPTRIRKLEAEVQRLTQEIRRLRAEGTPPAPQGLRAEHRATGTSPAPQSVPAMPRVERRIGTWPNRLVLVAMILIVAAATLAALSAEGFSLSRLASLDQDTASLRVDPFLLACAALAILAFACYLLRWPLTFLVSAILTTYLACGLYLAHRPGFLPLGDETYPWLALGGLSVCYLSFAVACINHPPEARRTRRVAAVAVLNSLVCFPMLWYVLGEAGVEGEWKVLLAGAILLGVLAYLAERQAVPRESLFQVFVVKCVILFTLALDAFLPSQFWLTGMALECAVLAWAYRNSGVVLLKVLNLILLLITFIACIGSLRTPDTVDLATHTIPANWFIGFTVPGLLVAVAVFYERMVSRMKPEQRRLSGHWVLADTVVDVPSATAAMQHAAAAALILVTVTIVDQGAEPHLPYLLMLEAVIFAVVGLILRTPQVEVAAVLLLVATYVSYYWGQSDIVAEPGLYTPGAPFALLATVLGFFGAYRWDQYIRRIEGGHPWEHHALASVPYALATVMVASVAGRELGGIYGPLAQGGIALTLFGAGFALKYPALMIGCFGALVMATGSFLVRLYSFGEPLADQAVFPIALPLFLAAYIAAERLVRFAGPRDRPGKAIEAGRSLLVVTAGVLGVVALMEWAPPAHWPAYWLGYACVVALLSTALRDPRYRWTALLIVVCAGAQAATLVDDPLARQALYLSAGLVVAVFAVLAFSWRQAFVARRRSPQPPNHG